MQNDVIHQLVSTWNLVITKVLEKNCETKTILPELELIVFYIQK